MTITSPSVQSESFGTGSHRPQPQVSAASEIFQETSALTRRLFLQLIRRPTTLVAGILQPLIWLILFGALFANAPEGLLPGGGSYGRFLGAGVIVFTAFSAALNAGLPVMFDREFGFLNRLLVAPLRSRTSIVSASVIYITLLSLIQSTFIIITAGFLGYGWPSVTGMLIVTSILSLLIFAVTALSLALAFSLPGHIELIAVIFISNLPLLFASTALAPLNFMPNWLAWLASFNPLTFAIEPIRASYSHDFQLTDIVLNAPYGSLDSLTCIGVLASLAIFLFIAVRPLLNRRLN